MNPDTIVTYTIARPRIAVPWWKDLLCFLFGHRWPKWKRVSEHTEERNCGRCKILGVRAPAWTVMP
jgi:hypothetical protein